MAVFGDLWGSLWISGMDLWGSLRISLDLQGSFGMIGIFRVPWGCLRIFGSDSDLGGSLVISKDLGISVALWCLRISIFLGISRDDRDLR